MQSQTSAGSVSFKLILFLLLLVLDLAISSFVEMSFATPAAFDEGQAIAILAINLITCGGLVLMLYVMMWQTFLLRYGLIRVLLAEFKLTLLLSLAVFLLTAGERVYHLVLLLSLRNEALVFAQPGYQVLYYLRFLAYPAFYCVLVRGCLELGLPKFYLSRKWLKLNS
jgi:hypothetical protein